MLAFADQSPTSPPDISHSIKTISPYGGKLEETDLRCAVTIRNSYKKCLTRTNQYTAPVKCTCALLVIILFVTYGY